MLGIRFSILAVLFLVCGTLSAHNDVEGDTIVAKKRSVVGRVWNAINSVINEFSNVDTAYIEPQHYKFQVMGLNTNRFEYYHLQMSETSSVTFAPEVSSTFGPYVGYSLLFLGQTFQLNQLYIGDNKKNINFSLYTSLFGGDLSYSENDNYKIRSVSVDNVKVPELENIIGRGFGGFNVKSFSVNLYYIANHRKHSYPATYNQSTCQKVSCGSPLFGIGYSNYSMSLDWDAMEQMAAVYLPGVVLPDDDLLRFNNLTYRTLKLYSGYSYNWVFARNWLLGSSVSVSLNYNNSHGDDYKLYKFFDKFEFKNISVGGLGRVGLVWNNTRMFAGASAQIHAATFHHYKYSINNIFGNANFYVGFNFGKKKAYRTPGKIFEF